MATSRRGRLQAVPEAPPRPRLHANLELMSVARARELLAWPFPLQRPLRPFHVTFLRSLMRTGYWRQGAEIHLARLHEQVYVLNGMHTLTALANEGTPQWLCVIESTVESFDAASRLYQTFDRPLQRSLRDLYSADSTLTALGLSPRQLSRVGSSMPVLMEGFQRGHDGGSYERIGAYRNATFRGACIVEWADEARRWVADLHGSNAMVHHMERAAVVAVALCTYRYQADKAARFWAAAANDSGLQRGQPEKALVDFLRTTGSRQYRPETYARFVASAWNAFYRGAHLVKCKAVSPLEPLMLLGTPHDGKRQLTYVTSDQSLAHDPVELDAALAS